MTGDGQEGRVGLGAGAWVRGGEPPRRGSAKTGALRPPFASSGLPGRVLRPLMILEGRVRERPPHPPRESGPRSRSDSPWLAWRASALAFQRRARASLAERMTRLMPA